MPTYNIDILSFVAGAVFGVILLFALLAILRGRD